MLKILIIDSSTLIALDRVDLIPFLDKLNYNFIIPQSIREEIGDTYLNCKKIKVETLNGKTVQVSKNLQELNIGSGEADCVALANSYNLDFIVCDDRKLLRQIFFSKNPILKRFKIVGFSFLLYQFYKKGLINNVWEHFEEIIKKSKWERSEVEVTNYLFLKNFV